MLSARYRLTSAGDFRRVHTAGQSWSNRMLVLVRSPNGLPYSRFGFSVSRRIGGAVVRNRTKRLISEVIRLRRDLIPGGWDIVFIARQGIREADYWSIHEGISHLLGVAGLV